MNLGVFTIIIQVDLIVTSSNEDSHLPPKKVFPSLSNLKIERFSFLGQKVWTAKE